MVEAFRGSNVASAFGSYVHIRVHSYPEFNVCNAGLFMPCAHECFHREKAEGRDGGWVVVEEARGAALGARAVEQLPTPS